MNHAKASAIAHSNIALVKYWGKDPKTEALRLPVNSSVAITLDAIKTHTTVEFDENQSEDTVEIDNDTFSTEETKRVSEHIDLLRTRAKVTTRARVKTKNNFPKGVGAASSASGFAALTVATSKALGLELTQKELSIIARQGSGSASRSIPGGVSVWNRGVDSDSSFAERIVYPQEWDLRILLIFVGEMKQKKIGSTEGMKVASTSPYFQTAILEAEKNKEKIQRALQQGDWKSFGKIIEDECFRLHMLCMTSTPNILYWEDSTIAIFQKLLELREQNVDGFFTVDAGPHVHIICQSKDIQRIKQSVQTITGVKEIVECRVGSEASVTEDHLF